MAAEVVVVVEDEDARRRAGGLAEVVGGGQAADAAAHHDQVVALAGVAAGRRVVPERPVAQGVRGLERAVVAAAQAGERRRVGSRAPGRLAEAQPERLAR